MQASQELDTIPAILRNNADQSGDSTALIYNYNKITYGTLHELVLNASCGLSKLGYKKWRSSRVLVAKYTSLHSALPSMYATKCHRCGSQYSF